MRPLQEIKRREKKFYKLFIRIIVHVSFLHKTFSLSLSRSFALLALKHYLHAALKERFSTLSLSLSVSLILTRVASRKEEDIEPFSRLSLSAFPTFHRSAYKTRSPRER